MKATFDSPTATSLEGFRGERERNKRKIGSFETYAGRKKKK